MLLFVKHTTSVLFLYFLLYYSFLSSTLTFLSVLLLLIFSTLVFASSINSTLLLLTTASTPTSPAVVGLQLVGYTRLRHCKLTDWLLQHCSCWCTKDSNGQVTACVERCCACRHRHLEIWPRPRSDTAWRTSLARRPRPGVFQAGSDSSPVSEWALFQTFA